MKKRTSMQSVKSVRVWFTIYVTGSMKDLIPKPGYIHSTIAAINLQQICQTQPFKTYDSQLTIQIDCPALSCLCPQASFSGQEM